MSHLINSGFNFINIERNKCESFQNYMTRCHFIVNNLKKEKYNLEQLLEKAIIFQAITVLGCKYPTVIMEEIKEMCEYAGIKY